MPPNRPIGTHPSMLWPAAHPSRRGTTRRDPRLSLAPVALAGLLAAGCASSPTPPPFTPTGDPVVDGRARLERAPKRDRVLWQYRVATTALRRGQWVEARSLLDDALATLQGLAGPDQAARRSRGQFSAEAKKTFIGEPYERVMAYYYRGLLYWMDGEPDNARACFRSGQFIDSDAENRTYAGDYVLLDYLDGLVSTRLGGDGSDALARAQKNARLARPAAFQTPWNTFFFMECGHGPTKYATGEYGEQLRFRAGQSKAVRARIAVAGQTLHAEAWDDLSFQATTRGGRVMDHVLANKAVFKQATDAAGTAAIIGGAILASQQGHQNASDEVGAGLVVAGLIAKLVSAATTPAADTRTWDNLPNYIGFTAASLPPGNHTASVDFLDAQDQAVLPTRTVPVHVREEGPETVILLSDRDR